MQAPFSVPLLAKADNQPTRFAAFPRFWRGLNAFPLTAGAFLPHGRVLCLTFPT